MPTRETLANAEFGSFYLNHISLPIRRGFPLSRMTTNN